MLISMPVKPCLIKLFFNKNIHQQLSCMYPFIKRFFDILFSLIALLLLSPVFIPIVILLLLTGEHEVFYRQDRVGYKNRIFGILYDQTRVAA